MLESAKTSAPEQPQPPETNSTSDLKSFINKLAQLHDKFCEDCRLLIFDALNTGSQSDVTDYTDSQEKEKRSGFQGGPIQKPDKVTERGVPAHGKYRLHQ